MVEKLGSDYNETLQNGGPQADEQEVMLNVWKGKYISNRLRVKAEIKMTEEHSLS